MKQAMTTTTAALVAVVAWWAPAVAAERHPRTGPRAEAPPAASQFYPDKVEGGVDGNLPFNNQIRKHTDPLNANGAK